MPVTTTVKTIVAPFGVEIDTPRNGDVLLQAIPGCRLRGAVRAGKVVTKDNGDTVAMASNPMADPDRLLNRRGDVAKGKPDD